MSDTNSDDEIEFLTDRGAKVTVTAEGQTLYVTVPSIDAEHEVATLTTEEGKDVLDAGIQEDASGEFHAFIPVGDNLDAIEDLKTDPTTDEPLAYEVEEREKSSVGGRGTYTVERLAPTKAVNEMTERQQELHAAVDEQHDVPEGAEPGDVYAVDDLLDDPRTDEEREAEALEEAEGTGEDVVIETGTTGCNDPDKECSLDHVSRIATPDGEIVEERAHTY